MSNFVPRPGAVRFYLEDGKWASANPGDPMFSTYTMLATQYFDLEEGWIDIVFEDNEGQID